MFYTDELLEKTLEVVDLCEKNYSTDELRDIIGRLVEEVLTKHQKECWNCVFYECKHIGTLARDAEDIEYLHNMLRRAMHKIFRILMMCFPQIRPTNYIDIIKGEIPARGFKTGEGFGRAEVKAFFYYVYGITNLLP